MAGGAPTLYREEFNELAYNYCLLGATDKELAEFFKVAEQTVNNWKVEYPEFFESITRGKGLADANVAKSLYHRAVGYEHPELITATFQGQITDTMEVTKHYPPDTVAAQFWLKNRRPNQWRDKFDVDVTPKQDYPTLEEIDARLERLRLMAAESE